MNLKLNETAKTAAKKMGKDKGAARKKANKAKADKMKNETAVEKTKREADTKKKKDAWKKKKKRKFTGKMKLANVDLTKTDDKTKALKANYEEAVRADLALTEEDEVKFTYTKVDGRRRRLLAAGTDVSYEITVADDNADAVETALLIDPEGNSIIALAAALSDDGDNTFDGVTATLEAPESEEIAADITTDTTAPSPSESKQLSSAPAGTAPAAVMWAIGAASVAASLSFRM